MSFQNDAITGIPAPPPTDYDRQYNFTDYQVLNPGQPMPGQQLDIEFNAIEKAVDETQARLRLIQRDDGALADESVGLDQLKNEARIGVNTPQDWMPFTQYAVNDSVIVDDGAWYVALVSHVSSGSFQDDVDDGFWEVLIDLTPYTLEAKNWATYPVDQLVPEGNGTDEYSAWHHRYYADQAQGLSEAARDASQQAQGLSEDARDASQEAQGLSEAARDASQQAQGLSEDARDASQEAQGLSEAAQAASEAVLRDFRDRYWGEYASDPSSSPGNGTAPAAGNLYWNTTDDRIKIHNGTQWTNLDLTGAVLYTALTGSATLPAGSTAQRDATAQPGFIRFNTETGKFEGYGNDDWIGVGGGATGGGGDQVFVLNDQVVTEDFEIPAGKNAHSVGPITVADPATVVVPSGSYWEVSGE